MGCAYAAASKPTFYPGTIRKFVSPGAHWAARQDLPPFHLPQTDKADPTDPMPRRQSHGLGNDFGSGLPVGLDAQFCRGAAVGEGREARRHALENRRPAVPGKRAIGPVRSCTASGGGGLGRLAAPGRSTLRAWVSSGVVTMKITSRTSMTSMRGSMLISARAAIAVDGAGGAAGHRAVSAATLGATATRPGAGPASCSPVIRKVWNSWPKSFQRAVATGVVRPKPL